MLNIVTQEYPLHLTYVCTLPCKVMRVKIVTKVISRYLLAKLRGLRQKHSLSACSKHISCIDYHEHSKCSQLAVTRYQTVTPLLNWVTGRPKGHLSAKWSCADSEI